MRRTSIVIPLVAAALFVPSAQAFAANPPGTGQPGQSCQDLEPNTPGHSSASPGSPFNEPQINSANGGTGGQHYSEKSQYDVACFQMSQK
jgi:hypothetical protein